MTISASYFLGSKDKGKSPLHFFSSLSIFLILLKFLVIVKKNLEQLHMYLQNTEWPTQQGETHEDNFLVLQSLSVIQSFLLY